MDFFQAILDMAEASGHACKPVRTDKERTIAQAESYNRTPGKLDLDDGINCPECLNRGQFAKAVQSTFVSESGEQFYELMIYPCRCMKKRNSVRRLKSSGLEGTIKAYTFDTFVTDTTWRQALKQAAIAFAKAPQGWFFAGGQSGCGKTHICTAICREFILEGREVLYMLWRDEAVKLKSCVNDSEAYNREINKLKNIEVLYIDDLFKTGKDQNGTAQKPTAADINLAFEIINYRYVNPKFITIISSECGIGQLIDIDEAVGGRIAERAGANCFSIAPDKSKNYRLSKVRNL